MAYLALIRHGETEWNALEKFSGWTDISLTEKGHVQAKEAGEKIKHIHWDLAYHSELVRSRETLDEIVDVLEQDSVDRLFHHALNERNYGIYEGLSKKEVKENLGDDVYQKLRRAWDHPVEKGESLKNVYERIVPYFEQEIFPNLLAGKNVIVSAHNNSLRALIKFLDQLSADEVTKLELGNAEVDLYNFDSNGKILDKTIL